MKRKSPSFQFYPDAWLSSADIMLMTPAEEGAYVRLLCIAWMDADCSLPADSRVLASLSRLGDEWEGESGEKIRAKFVERDGRLYNERLLEERRKQREWSQKSSKGGLKSATSRAAKIGKGSSRLVDTKAQPNPNQVVDNWLPPKGNSSSSSSSSKKPPIVPPETDKPLDEEFHRLTELFPDPTKIDQACRTWISLVGSGVITSDNVGEIFEGLQRWLISEKWAEEAGRFRPSLASWLENKRWIDKPKPLETEQQHPPLPEWLGEQGPGFPDEEIEKMAVELGVPK